MKYDEGDLVAIRTLDDRNVTAIVLKAFNKKKFLYCYIIEEDSCVYSKAPETFDEFLHEIQALAKSTADPIALTDN